MRGGISYITKKFSKTNNKYMQSYENKINYNSIIDYRIIEYRF